MTARIAVGDVVPSLERTITLTDMVAYAGATWDWHKLHYDVDYVAAKQLPRPIVDGQVLGALLVEQVQDWLGPRCFVTELSFSFRQLVFAGETVRCEGTVVDVSGDRAELDLRVVVVGENGGTRPAVAPSHAVVMLGTADGPGGTRPSP